MLNNRAQRIVLCGEAAGDAPNNTNREPLRLRLLGKRSEVTLRLEHISRSLGKNIPARFVDLIELATYVYCADQAITRGAAGVDVMGAHWRRRFHFVVPVRELEFWRTASLSQMLSDTLGFLSEDEYEFEFVHMQNPPPVEAYLFEEFETPNPVEEVVLFSGGLDSLGGAVQESVVEHRRIALVTHRPTEKLRSRHDKLCGLLAQHARGRAPKHIEVTINKDEELGKEYTQRTRSFLYASLAATVAQLYDLSRIRFYENGVISLNLPLSPEVVGAKATRTTHPRVLCGFAELFTKVADRPFEVENPFMWKTKSEVVRQIAEAGCAELIGLSTSCTHTWEISLAQPHCGSCSQCIDRRFSILAAGQAEYDPVAGYKTDLVTGTRSPGEHRTMLSSYVDTVQTIRRMQSPIEFVARYGEVGRVLRYLPGGSDVAATKIFELFQRHARAVNEVIVGAIRDNSGKIAERTLPDSCLLRLIYDVGAEAEVSGATPTSAEQTKAENAAELIAHEPLNAFKRSGAHWIARFGSEREFIVPHSKGAVYLHELLRNAGRPVSATALACLAAKDPHVLAEGDAGHALDKQAVDAYRARFEEVEQHKKDAAASGDEEEIDEADRRLNF